MAGRLAASEKCSSVIPMVIGEVLRSLPDNLILCVGGSQAKEVYESAKLCTGLKVDLEGIINIVRERDELGRR